MPTLEDITISCLKPSSDYTTDFTACRKTCNPRAECYPEVCWPDGGADD